MRATTPPGTTPRRKPHRRAGGRGVLAAVCAVLLSTSCAGTSPDPAAGETPHGYVEGAEEAAEAQSRLVVADAGSGAVHVVDLITEKAQAAGRVTGVRSIAGDGRFGYLGAADGTVRVVDSGSWMVDHGDHVHYYRAGVRDVGSTPGDRPVSAFSDPKVTALSFTDGSVRLLDRERLDQGSISQLAEIGGEPHPATAVPYGEHVLVSVAETGRARAGRVRVHGRDGKPVADVDVTCPELSGQAVTRRGVVFGCADGALLVTEKDGTFTGRKIPYPGRVAPAERATVFTHRPGSTTLAAPAGDRAVWSLDVTDRRWTRITTGPVAAVNAVGEGGPMLVLTADGVLRAHDPVSGAEQARTSLMTPAAVATTPPAIRIDTTRAYVNDPSGGRVFEIDYNDRLRRARTLTVPGRASLIVETGR